MSTPVVAGSPAKLGRPRVYQERLSDFVTITLTPSQRRFIEDRAQAEGECLCTFARRLLLGGPVAPVGISHGA